MSIEVIRPEIFQEEESVQAFVTLKNENLSGAEHHISGLNLGYNTKESPEVITQNRQMLIRELGLSEDRVAFASQVHSNRTNVITTGGTFPDTDGLITQIPGLALAIQIADCPAVLIADTTSRTTAAVHAGWRGASSNIVPKTLEKMEQVGAKSDKCRAFISPCICLDHFEVGREVAEQFPDLFVDNKRYKKPHVDLKKYLQHQLLQGGLSEKNIEVHPGCTVGNEQYYSYRREGEQSGRMMAVIQMSNE